MNHPSRIAMTLGFLHFYMVVFPIQAQELPIGWDFVRSNTNSIAITVDKTNAINANAIDVSNMEEKEEEKYHEVYLTGFFFFGAGGDEVFSGLYVVPVGSGIAGGYIYNDDFMRYHFLVVATEASLLSPYEKINAGYDSLNEEVMKGMLFFSSTFTVWQGNDIHLKIGPGIHFYIDLWISYPVEGIPDISRFSWFSHTGLGPALFWEWQVEPQHQISMQFYVPIFNVGWRPGYAIFTFEQERLWETENPYTSLFYHPFFMSFHNFVFLNFQFHYRYFFHPNWSLNLNYQGDLQYTDQPRKRLDIHNQVELGFSFHW